MSNIKQRSVNKVKESFFFSNIVVNLWNNLLVCTHFTSLSKFSTTLNIDYMVRYCKANFM